MKGYRPALPAAIPSIEQTKAAKGALAYFGSFSLFHSLFKTPLFQLT